MTAIAQRKLTTQERMEMLNNIILATTPITKARAKLQQRYGRVAMIEIEGAMGSEKEDIVLPPKIAEIDAELVRLDAQIRETILKEYGQIVDSFDPEAAYFSI